MGKARPEVEQMMPLLLALAQAPRRTPAAGGSSGLGAWNCAAAPVTPAPLVGEAAPPTPIKQLNPAAAPFVPLAASGATKRKQDIATVGSAPKRHLKHGCCAVDLDDFCFSLGGSDVFAAGASTAQRAPGGSVLDKPMDDSGNVQVPLNEYEQSQASSMVFSIAIVPPAVGLANEDCSVIREFRVEFVVEGGTCLGTESFESAMAAFARTDECRAELICLGGHRLDPVKACDVCLTDSCAGRGILLCRPCGLSVCRKGFREAQRRHRTTTNSRGLPSVLLDARCSATRFW